MPLNAALGLDFGTLSVRAILVNTRTGDELATSSEPYAHGVIDAKLAGKKLPPEFALQDPRDYLDAVTRAVRNAMKAARLKPAQVVGIGVDFTACTILPTDAQGQPLCLDARFAKQPHAYVKLWKHHAAHKQTDRINELARARNEAFLPRYGAGVNCEWLLPKALQMFEDAPEVFAAAEKIIEAGDWLVWQLCGAEARNACAAGYKGCWHAQDGYVSAPFLEALRPGFGVLLPKVRGKVVPAGTPVGGLTSDWAKRLGLEPGTPVGAGIIDAHAAVPACNFTRPGDLVIILGTSFCHMLLGEAKAPGEVKGIAGAVRDGILPGLMGYEAGQAGGGDLLSWCVRSCGTAELTAEARKRKCSLYELLGARAAKFAPGETGLVALDWLNGNRSPLNRADLSGLFLGVTLATPSEALYRALQEALAFGTRTIIETFEAQGLPVKRIATCGGIAEKDAGFMQILADVTQREIGIARSGEACAVGAAILGAVAAGAKRGGYDGFDAAAQALGGLKTRTYKPNAAAGKTYDALYAEYRTLSAYFGAGGNDVMRRLRELRAHL